MNASIRTIKHQIGSSKSPLRRIIIAFMWDKQPYLVRAKRSEVVAAPVRVARVVAGVRLELEQRLGVVLVLRPLAQRALRRVQVLGRRLRHQHRLRVSHFFLGQ